MSRRREAAELARVLALSTQQTRDIAEISPHSLSSGHAGATQDSRDMELKLLQPMGQAPTGLSEDEVALFSSRSAEDEANQSRIESFNPSEALHHSSALDSPSHHRAMAAPLTYVRRDPEIAIPENMARIPTSGPSSGHLSPTQLSAQVVPDSDLAATSKTLKHDIQTGQQRTPLRPRASNQAFQLSSSPIEASNSPKKAAHASSKHIDALSDSEEIEVIETVRPTPASKRRRPEIVLQSRSTSRARSRLDSPDPLDLIPSGSADTFPSIERHSAQPRSSATESNHVGTERKSSRVQAAAEKKELEKEEKRRLRRERKAKEEAERIARDSQEPTAKSKRQKSAKSATAAKPTTYSGSSSRGAKSTTEVNRSSATPSTSHISPVKSITKPPAEPRIARARASIAVATPPEEVAAEESLPMSPVKTAEADTIDEEPTSPKLAAQESPTPDEAPRGGDIVEPKIHDARSESPFADPRRRELAASSSSSRQSPGPAGPDGRPQRPDGIRWQTSRNDLSRVLAKFGGARPAGMSKRHRIAPLHAKIGTPAKALPPVPQKPVKRKKGDESDDEDSDQGGSEDENGVRKPKSKVKGMDWFMVED